MFGKVNRNFFLAENSALGFGSDGTVGGERWAGSAQNEQLLHAGPGVTRPFPDGKKVRNPIEHNRQPPPAAAALLCSELGAHQPPLRPPFVRRTARLEWTGAGNVDCSGVCCLCSNKGREGAACWQSSARDVLSIGENLQVMQRCSFCVYPSIVA